MMFSAEGANPTDRIRVLRIIARMNMGGPAHHVSLLSGLMDPSRFETLLVSGRVGMGEAPLTEPAERHGVYVHTLKTLAPELSPVHDARALGELARIVRRFRPDIVHTHTAKAGLLGRMAAFAPFPTRPVIVHTYHGHVLESYFDPVRTYTYRVAERALSRVSDLLIGVSQATVNDLVRLGIAPASRFRVIPLGLELDRFLSLEPRAKSPIRADLGADRADLLLVFMGRLVPIKRVDVTLRAVAAGRRLGAPLRLAIVGDGPLRDELERLARELGLAEVVRFLGYRSDLEEIVAAADVGVLTSDNEGTPVSLIEIGAAGRPLVATDVGGVSDVVVEGAGLLAAPGDHAGLGQALATLAAERSLAERMGLRAREHIGLRFSVERLIGDMTELYDELLLTRASSEA